MVSATPMSPASQMWFPARVTMSNPASASAFRAAGSDGGAGTSVLWLTVVVECGTSTWPIVTSAERSSSAEGAR